MSRYISRVSQRLETFWYLNTQPRRSQTGMYQPACLSIELKRIEKGATSFGSNSGSGVHSVFMQWICGDELFKKKTPESQIEYTLWKLGFIYYEKLSHRLQTAIFENITKSHKQAKRSLSTWVSLALMWYQLPWKSLTLISSCVYILPQTSVLPLSSMTVTPIPSPCKNSFPICKIEVLYILLRNVTNKVTWVLRPTKHCVPAANLFQFYGNTNLAGVGIHSKFQTKLRGKESLP